MEATLLSPTMMIKKYDGPWTTTQAKHLLRRTTFGINISEVDQIVAMGMDAAVDYLLRDENPLPHPINKNLADDPIVPIGETWVDKPYSQRGNGEWRRSLASWTGEHFVNDRLHIRQKLSIFWHNHFVTSDINDARFVYRYYYTLMNGGLGSFVDLVKAITIDPAMLRYLNGNQNTRQSPNENYARELLELFTVGKGELAGSGDYTTFTEDDVRAIARVLTGWRDFGHTNPALESFGSTFAAGRHDNGDKQLSHRFNNVVVADAGEQEYAVLIDIIMQSPHVGEFIARKFYRYFVFYEIDSIVQEEVLSPLATLFRDSGYNIKTALKALLTSEHFYQEDHIGCMIKNPIDYIIGLHTSFDTEEPRSDRQLDRYYRSLLEFGALLQMTMFAPPSVAGWKAYYQEPSYYQLWINSVTLPLRRLLTDAYAVDGSNDVLGIDVLKSVLRVSDPYDINFIIKEWSEWLFPKPLQQNQLDSLKAVVLGGLPDFEWTVEYTDYVQDPTNADKRTPIETKLKILFLSMLRLPEYNLS